MEKRDHKPTAELIKQASVISDPEERQRVIGEIKDLRRRYAGTNAEFKAPNGQPSVLIAALGDEPGQQAWYAVRTPSFKNWFGDWEQAARIEIFKNSQDMPLDGNAYQGKYELNKESILNYLKNTLSKSTMRNPAIMEDIRLGGTGIDKLIGWGMNNDVYKKLFAHIPKITENAVLITEEMPNRPNAHYNKYSHLAGGLKIDGDPHTVHIILGESGGQWYYSHILLHIEKGSLLNGIRQSTPGHPKSASLSDIKDTTLLRLLQADSSKIIDENGEPLPVCLGDKSKREMSAEPQGISFAGDKTAAADFLFLNIKNPLVLNENSFNYYDIDNLNPFIQTLGYDGVARPYSNEFFAFDPSQIKSVIGEVVLTRKTGTAKFYLHEVETQEKLRGVSIQAGIESGTPLGASKLIIGKKLNEVKENISKIIDRNGDLIKNEQSKLTIDRQIELAKKAGYVQGVCECVAAIGDDHTLGKKLLSEMNVTKDMAKKYANSETYKALEQGIFTPQQKLEQTHSIKRW